MERTVVNKRHNVPYDVYIGRGSKWGNPFSHMSNTKAQFKVKNRSEAISRYREWILRQPELIEQLPEIKGKIKGCYCFPAECHGDILEELSKELPDLTGVMDLEECPSFIEDGFLCSNDRCPRRYFCEASNFRET